MSFAEKKDRAVKATGIGSQVGHSIFSAKGNVFYFHLSSLGLELGIGLGIGLRLGLGLGLGVWVRKSVENHSGRLVNYDQATYTERLF